MSAFAMFETKSKRMRRAIEELECAVASKREKVNTAEVILWQKIERAKKELERPPPAGALAWRGHNGHD